MKPSAFNARRTGHTFGHFSSLIAIAVVTALVTGCSSLPSEQVVPMQPASTLDFNRLKGKVVVLAFWASWCGHCRDNFSWLKELSRTLPSNGAVVIGVSMDGQRADAEAFVKEMKANFASYHDGTGELAKRYRVHAIPVAFVLDAEGQVEHTYSGHRAAELAQRANEIKVLLK